MNHFLEKVKTPVHFLEKLPAHAARHFMGKIGHAGAHPVPYMSRTSRKRAADKIEK